MVCVLEKMVYLVPAAQALGERKPRGQTNFKRLGPCGNGLYNHRRHLESTLLVNDKMVSLVLMKSNFLAKSALLISSINNNKICLYVSSLRFSEGVVHSLKCYLQ